MNRSSTANRRSLRASLALLASVVATLLAHVVLAEDASVPVGLQMELFAKIAAYDKNLPARAGDKLVIVLLVKSGSDESTKAAKAADKALADIGTIAGLSHEQSTVAFSDAAALAKLCKTKHVGAVYVAPGFADSDVEAMAKGLDGADVLTVSGVASFVSKGVVVGFDLVSGKPKLLVNLNQAKKQKVELSAEVLKLMKVVE